MKTPYGYRLEKSGILNKRKREVNKLVIDDAEAEVIRMMFDLCVSSGYGNSGWPIFSMTTVSETAKVKPGMTLPLEQSCTTRSTWEFCAAVKPTRSRLRNCRS